jgi:hypothetical protein
MSFWIASALSATSRDLSSSLISCMHFCTYAPRSFFSLARPPDTTSRNDLVMSPLSTAAMEAKRTRKAERIAHTVTPTVAGTSLEEQIVPVAMSMRLGDLMPSLTHISVA